MLLTQCRFEANTSPGFGGSIYIDMTTSASQSSSTQITIDSCFFIDNAAPQGGAIYLSGDITIVNTTFSGNFAGAGSEIYLNSPSPGSTKIIGCTFQGVWTSQDEEPTGVYCVLGHLIIEDSFFQNVTAVSWLLI